jgi:site-specific recombinase XerD
MTPKELLQKFLTHIRIEKGLSPATCESYRYQVEHFLRFLDESVLDLISTASPLTETRPVLLIESRPV